MATPVGVLAMFTDVAAAVALLLLLSVAKVTWLSSLHGLNIGEGMAKDGTGPIPPWPCTQSVMCCHATRGDTGTCVNAFPMSLWHLHHC